MARRSSTASKPATAPDTLLRNLGSALEHRLGTIEYRPTGSLQAYTGRARKHPEKQIIQLMASMREFGFALPVLVDTDGVLVTGHARIEAAKRIGLETVPVLVADCWSRAQVRAYRLADNQLATAASWDEELLRIELASIIEVAEVPVELLGWSTGEVDVILDGGAQIEDGSDPDDEVPPVPEVPTARAGDLWLLGKHRLLCGSSLEPVSWERLLAGQTAARVLTDGPYNVPVNGHVSGSKRFAEFKMASGEMRQHFPLFLMRVFEGVRNSV